MFIYIYIYIYICFDIRQFIVQYRQNESDEKKRKAAGV